jgi:outer membrane protein OmpA-like peptidoglycan-associated protein
VPSELRAIDWPWKKKPPHELTARCSIEPSEIELGTTGRLRATIEASDTHGHSVAYVWSGNGGVLSGTGPAIEVDVSQVNPGVYSVQAVAQDAHKLSASCIAHYRVRVLPPADLLTMSCRTEPEVVQVGAPVQVRAEATDQMNHELRYRWFTNGGEIEGEGPAVALRTTDLAAGVYTITGRVEDGFGRASDCVVSVSVEPLPPPPPPPPPPAEPLNIAQIVFGRNRAEAAPAELAPLEAVLERLRAEPEGRISIEAYADPDEREPQRLAAARAGAILRYFLERGVPQSRVATVVGLGGRRGGLRNRTVDIIWLPEGVQF